MIVRRLRMENIRSYGKAEIEFAEGRTLFEGDIGSGKSTILMAIEFALFGLGSARASSLLRLGQSRGSVELEFESNGKEYWVRRELARKAGSIQQVEGKIRGPEGEEDYPSTEMKERILALLKFREPTDPKSRSLIYQYAIYTPQEEMKQILLLRPDIRTQILRRAFGVEEYKLATENAGELLRRVQSKRSLFGQASKEIPSLKKELEELERKLEKGAGELERLGRAEKESVNLVERLERRKDEMHELELSLTNALSDKKHLAAELQSSRVELEGVEGEAEALVKKGERVRAKGGASGGPPSEKSVDELKRAIAAARNDIAKHEADGAVMGTKIGEYEAVAKSGKCPVCDREANPEDFASKASDLEDKRRRNSEHLAKLNEDLHEAEVLLEERREYDNAKARAEEDAELVEEFEKEARKKEKQAAVARGAIASHERSIADLDARIVVLRGETEELEPMRRKIETARKELDETKEKMADLRGDIKRWETDARRCKDSILNAESSASKARALAEREIWLEEYFIPTVGEIEKHVMVSINREFAGSFQRWLGMLVEDSGKEARIDEEFTPVVEQEGYEQDVEFLSGGERTSVALAYRLALSQLVQKYAEAGPSSLILDEPTDGFSKEQLGKLREILDEMANPQVIFVSHERELESMADQIYRVAKVDGESRITR